MFTQDDFIQLFRYLKGDSVTLDPNLIILAENAYASSTSLFTNNLDLQCQMTDDYMRLREFLITWYSTHKTFVNLQSKVSDARSLPEDHLNILMNSFGYSAGLSEITYTNKLNLFYDEYTK